MKRLLMLINLLLAATAASAKDFGEEVRVTAIAEGEAFVVRNDRSSWTCPAEVVEQRDGKDVIAMKEFLKRGSCKEGGATHAELRRKANEVSPEMKAQVRQMFGGMLEQARVKNGLVIREVDGSAWRCRADKLDVSRGPEGEPFPVMGTVFTNGTCTRAETPP
jgi:hypothetical protein